MKKKYKNKFHYQQLKRKKNEKEIFDFSKKRKEKIIPIIIVFSLPVLLYLQTLAYGFTCFDDDTLISNYINFFRDFHNVTHVFLTDAFIVKTGSFYRPLQNLSYMIDIQFSGGNNAWMYHLSNILLLGIIASILFLLLRKFLIPLKLALLSTLVYCAHPLFISNIAWIPARGDLQLMLFSLLSFLFLIEFIQNRKIIYLFLHCVTFTIALFCKETAALLPFLYIMYYFSFIPKNAYNKKYIFVIVLYAISGLFWFCLRAKAIGGFSNKNDEIGLLPVLINLQTIPESLTKFFLPFNIAPIPSFSYFETIVGLGIILAICILFFKNKVRSKKEKIFCFLWFLFLLFPTMIYKHNIIDYLNHRFFLPMIGILLFTLFMFPEKWFKNGDVKNSLIIIIVLIILSSFTFVKSRSYSDPMTFYNSAISENSNSDIAYNNRGVMYNARGMYDKAISDYTKAVELNPYYCQAYYNRGVAYKAQELYDKAINDYTKAIELKSDYTEAYYNCGNIYRYQGLYDKAIYSYTKAIELKPDYADAYNNRGIAYNSQGLFDKSYQDFKKAEELGSNDAKNNVIKFNNEHKIH